MRISVCHCLDCKKRSGSSFSAQVRFAGEDVVLSGDFREWSHVGDSGFRTTFRFCPDCGSTLTYSSTSMPGVVAIALGGFDDPFAFTPLVSVWEERKHDWVDITGDAIEHMH